MKYLIPAIRFKVLMLILLGIIYPLAMTAIAQTFFQAKANGETIMIAQKFESAKYFWPRPSAVDYNPLASGGSNLGPTSADLKKLVDERSLKLKQAHPDQTGEPPQDLLFASASGLDPEMSPEAAQYQAIRISKARGIDAHIIRDLILNSIQPRDFGVFGERRVNVLALNLALDKTESNEKR